MGSNRDLRIQGGCEWNRVAEDWKRVDRVSDCQFCSEPVSFHDDGGWFELAHDLVFCTAELSG